MNYRKEASEALTELRNHPSKWMPYHSDMTQALKKGGLSLADIGTNEEELEGLRVTWCRFYALRYLARLRAGNPEFLRYLRDAVRKGGFSFADIGTSEEEINFFTQRSAQNK